MNNEDVETILKIENLKVGFQNEDGFSYALHGIDFEIKQSEILGIVGESGCGKSVTAMSLLKLLPRPSGKKLSGGVYWKGKDIFQFSDAELHSYRGNDVSMIFQEPMTALNPVRTVGAQILENMNIHKNSLSTEQKRQRIYELFGLVGISDIDRRFHQYPHELSGGLRQRVMIAMALSCEPELLIADEPTTALDVTIQAQILDLLQSLQKQMNLSVMLITHDLDVVAEVCDRVIVMYGGLIVEEASAKDIFNKPCHPYTKALINSAPRLNLKSKEELKVIPGQVKRLQSTELAECSFVERCEHARELCRQSIPKKEKVNSYQSVRCFRWRDIK